LQYEFIGIFSFHFKDEECSGQEEEVEDVGQEEDLEVLGGRRAPIEDKRRRRTMKRRRTTMRKRGMRRVWGWTTSPLLGRKPLVSIQNT
jgi:hypothetical protein